MNTKVVRGVSQNFEFNHSAGCRITAYPGYCPNCQCDANLETILAKGIDTICYQTD